MRRRTTTLVTAIRHHNSRLRETAAMEACDNCGEPTEDYLARAGEGRYLCPPCIIAQLGGVPRGQIGIQIEGPPVDRFVQATALLETVRRFAAGTQRSAVREMRRSGLPWRRVGELLGVTGEWARRIADSQTPDRPRKLVASVQPDHTEPLGTPSSVPSDLRATTLEEWDERYGHTLGDTFNDV